MGTGLLAAGMLLVAPAAIAFAGPGTGGRCAGGLDTNRTFCNNKDGGTTEPVSGTTTPPSPMSHQPCAKPTPATDSTAASDRVGGGGGR
jgi:hypothetical protein